MPDVAVVDLTRSEEVAGRQIYGIQSHPEKSETGKQFLRNFLELPLSEYHRQSAGRRIMPGTN